VNAGDSLRRRRFAVPSFWRATQVGSVFAYFAVELLVTQTWDIVCHGRRQSLIVALAERYYRAAILLGGAYVKIDQLLATRHDLFPPDAIKILRRLQEHLPPLAYQEISKILSRSLGHSG
jgi:predicted unusual protein kinase regulating ubiquinone biosynthesis (AarF/ABC1/UbiB family)